MHRSGRANDSNETVCAAARDAVSDMPVSPQRNLALSLLVGIQSHILGRDGYREHAQFRPISCACAGDEHAIVLEWAYRAGRITYFIDEDIEGSTAVFIDDMKSPGQPIMKEQDIRADSLSALIAESVAFVARFKA